LQLVSATSVPLISLSSRAVAKLTDVVEKLIRGTSGRFSERMLSCNALKFLDPNWSGMARDGGDPDRN
jgi:hypothetical protein